ncbi:MAG: LysR family transcriptional regulator [Treponemataceae bacterium]|nr:LysR family transcriptional regulator [Treponemataceae bacterium]
MDLELLKFRAEIMQKIRAFFIEKDYLELDSPALSSSLIPETCLEVFKTEYVEPWTGEKKDMYLVPSPEIYMKRIIAQHKVSVFQLSKCYRNVESAGRIHIPEFTMLEYYTMNASYKDSMAITEDLFNLLLPPLPSDGNTDPWQHLRPPFTRLTMDDAFQKYAGFRLSQSQTPAELAEHARRLGIAELPDSPFNKWPWDDLYELILVQCVDPALVNVPKPVFLMDYPAKVPCLAKDVPLKHDCAANGSGGKNASRFVEKDTPLWKERWELYAVGTELANCYTEEDNPENVREYFKQEGRLKNETALIPHATDDEYWKVFKDFPHCSGVAMGVDRLIMLLAGRKSIESVLPFPFRTQPGCY